MYPRLMTGPVVKSNGPARKSYLADWPMPLSLRRRAEDSEDAFDAAISALVMSQHLDTLRGLKPASDPVTRLEGVIWVPPQHGGAASLRHEPDAGATISYRPGAGYPSR
jgi:hypothetical protein